VVVVFPASICAMIPILRVLSMGYSRATENLLLSLLSGTQM
jgi:hypothetical protein